MKWPKPYRPEFKPAGSRREYWEDYSKFSEKFNLDLLEFYTTDLAKLVRIREKFSHDPEIRFMIPAMIEETEQTIKELGEIIKNDRKRFSEIAKL